MVGKGPDIMKEVCPLFVTDSHRQVKNRMESLGKLPREPVVVGRGRVVCS